MVLLGVSFGVIYAVLTSLGNVLSRRFVIVHHASVFRMLVMSHFVMSLLAAAALPLLWTPAVPPISSWLLVLIEVLASYMAGQVLMLRALQKTDSSRITPLLGLKVFMVALMAWAVTGVGFTAVQWAAIGLSIAATFLLNRAGGRMPMSTLLTMVASCFCFALCDIRISVMNELLRDAAGLTGVLFGAMSLYVSTGIVSAALLPWFGTRDITQWKAAGQYGVLWLTAAVFLFLCFTLAGVVLGNIVIACRGLTAIAIGVLVAHLGHHHLEQRASRAVWIRRAIAAGVLVLAIALFKW